MERIMSKKKVKCSNSLCDFVYDFIDIKYSYINDYGFLIFKCPKCGNLTKTWVNNIDIYNLHPYYYDKYEIYESSECDDIIEGESTTENFKTENKIYLENKIWKLDDVDIYNECINIIKDKKEIVNKLNSIKNAYLASTLFARDIENLIFLINIRGQDCLLMKKIKSERDFTTDNLVFIGTERLNIKDLANGVYNRDYCYNILDSSLRRWKLLSNQVLFVTPFIGINYNAHKYEEEIIQFWNWLEEVIDINKTVFITRTKTFNKLKDILNKNEGRFDYLKEWNALSKLLMIADNYNARKKDANKSRVQTYGDGKFHAKFYAGIFDEYVEVLLGSYNIHLGKSLENICFLKYNRVDFQKKFLDPFKINLSNFILSEENNYQTALLKVSKKGLEVSFLEYYQYKDLIVKYL